MVVVVVEVVPEVVVVLVVAYRPLGVSAGCLRLRLAYRPLGVNLESTTSKPSRYLGAYASLAGCLLATGNLHFYA